MLEIAKTLYLRLVDDGVRFVDRELFGGRIEELDRLKTMLRRYEKQGYTLIKTYGPECGECEQELGASSVSVWALLEEVETK